MWMLPYRFFLHKVCDLVRRGQIINHLWQVWVHWNYKLGWAYIHKSYSQINLGIPHIFIYSRYQQCKSPMGRKYLFFFPPFSSYLPVHPAFVHFPFLHSICLKLYYFLLAEKSRNTASNIPQMIRSGFLTLHLTTLDERRRKWSSPNQQQGVIMAPFTVLSDD